MKLHFSSINDSQLGEKNPQEIPQSVESNKAPYFLLFLEGEKNVAELVFQSDTTFTHEMAREIKTKLEAALPGQKIYLLVGSKGFFRVTKKARELGAKERFSSHLAAVACYTNNASLALLAELYVKINKPAVPTRLFGNREAALEWLHECRKQNMR